MNAPASTRSPRKLLTFALFLLGLATLCVIFTWISLKLLQPHEWAHDQPHGHRWLHKELKLTTEEAARIDLLEAPFRADKQRLQVEMDRRIQRISTLLQQHDSLSPEVSEAVHDLHIVHGQIQQLSIEHYFEMLSVLPPEKQASLRALAADALSVPQ